MIRPSETLVGTNLNSVWLEGTLVADPEGVVDARGSPAFKFQIEDHRPLEPDPPSVFEIEANGSALETCRTTLGRGHRVRIIGRLVQKRRQITVISELVENIGP